MNLVAPVLDVWWVWNQVHSESVGAFVSVPFMNQINLFTNYLYKIREYLISYNHVQKKTKPLKKQLHTQKKNVNDIVHNSLASSHKITPDKEEMLLKSNN